MYGSCMMYDHCYILCVLYVCLFLGGNVLHTICMYASRKTGITPEYRIYSPLFDRDSSLTPTSPVLVSWGHSVIKQPLLGWLDTRVMQASGLSGHVATVT